MEQLFIRILNMSLTAGIVILAVVFIRFLLGRVRAPKIFSYVLWFAVLFRLLCPISFSMNFSLLEMMEAPRAEQGQMHFIPEDIGLMNEPKIILPGKNLTNMVNSSLPSGTPENSMNPMQGILFVGALFWLAGVFTMLTYSLTSYLKLKRKLKGAIKEEEKGNVYRTGQVGIPFVCGLFRPVIYLPSSLGEKEKDYIVLHEQIHIRRGDPFWRALGYLALSIHWFNPLVWLAFYFSGKDMEMSCDEAVVRKIGSNIRKEYSASLLSFACGRRVMPGFPMAFGEGETGSRIKNLFHYKKTGKMTAAILGIVCLMFFFSLTANPGEGSRNSRNNSLSCYEIPIGNGKLSWGMSREELTAIWGEPSAEEYNNAGTTMTYDIPMSGELGESSQVILYVGIGNQIDPEAPEGEKISNGLCGVMMTLQPTTKETVLEKIKNFYGELSPSGGSTQMEMQLREGIPNYFNEVHFCEDWRIGNLSETEYERLVESYRVNQDRPIDEESLLMCVYLWGVENGDSYPCVVQLDVSMMGVLAYLTE